MSGKCEYALFDASTKLERVGNYMTYVAVECEADLQANCSNVQSGEGSLLQCLEINNDKLSQRRRDALKKVGKK